MNKMKLTLAIATVFVTAFAASINAATIYDATAGTETTGQDLGQFTVNGLDNSGGDEARNKPGIIWRESGRQDMGWSGNGGGNLEAYSKGHLSRAGQFKFIYGGTNATMGKIAFVHYDGTNWTDRMVLMPDGSLGIDIGLNAPCTGCKLDVNGKIRATEIVVQSPLTWPDYVLKDNYNLMSLSEVDEFIKVNGHLPGIPNAEQVGKDGVALGEVSTIMLEKIEELTLHMIQLEKKNNDLEERLAQLQKRDVK